LSWLLQDNRLSCIDINILTIAEYVILIKNPNMGLVQIFFTIREMPPVSPEKKPDTIHARTFPELWRKGTAL
jgi:hypothetical protein